jgi:hypothetical protein
LDRGISPIGNVVVAATTAVTKITEDDQRGDESEKSVTETHWMFSVSII